jgi:hypothetical protein
MPIPRDHDNDWDDDYGEEAESAWEDFDDEDDGTMPCPYCRRPIHEEAERCPHCERYLSDEDAPTARKPWWVIAGAVICMYVAYRWVTG